MEETRNRKEPLPPTDPLAWSVGLLAAMASCLIAPELLARLLPDPSHRSSSPQGQDTTYPTVDWIPFDDPRIRPRFVEANPEVPENPPDNTEKFSFRDQQAAQPEAPVEESDAPKIEGDKPDTQKIVRSGDPGSPPPVPVAKPDSEAAKQFERGTPIGKNEAGQPKESPAEVPKGDQIEGLAVPKVEAQGKDSTAKKTIILNQEPPQPKPTLLAHAEPRTTPKPRPRPRLAPDLVRGPLMTTETNAPRLGDVAIDCRLHVYGAYVQEMLQAIEDQWHKLGHGSGALLNRNKLPRLVKLRYKLDTNGRIHDLTRLDSFRSGLAAEICRQAIESRAPYGKWTEEMIRDFGGEDEVTITFNYK